MRLSNRTYHNRGSATSRAFLVAAAGVLLLIPAATARGQSGEEDPVVRIEEDWVLEVNEPDELMHAPQFHTVMAPFGDLNTAYAQVLWNYRERDDEFVAGGLQLQMWDGEVLIRDKSVREQPLSTSAETIRWTQVLYINGSLLVFRVKNGQSTTWDTFGDGMVIEADTSLLSLSAYDPNVSVRNSCITFGSNRVNRLAIQEVRRYTASGHVYVDNSPRVVFSATETPADE